MFPVGHRNRGRGLSLQTLPEIELGMVRARQRGSTWYVNSNATAGGTGDTWGGAFTTLQAAIDRALVDDRIYLAPTHAENVATAGAITVNKAGLTIIGMGNGRRRPVFTWTGTAGSIIVSAADVVISNINCTSGIDEVVSLWLISGARVTLDAVDYFETAALTPIQFLLTTTAADDLELRNLRHYQGTTSGAANADWIEIIGADRFRLLDSSFFITLPNGATSSILLGSGTASLNIEVSRCVFTQLGGTTQDNVISLVASTTGQLTDVYCFGDVGTLAASIDLASCGANQVYMGATVNKNGILDPVVA